VLHLHFIRLTILPTYSYFQLIFVSYWSDGYYRLRRWPVRMGTRQNKHYSFRILRFGCKKCNLNHLRGFVSSLIKVNGVGRSGCCTPFPAGFELLWRLERRFSGPDFRGIQNNWKKERYIHSEKVRPFSLGCGKWEVRPLSLGCWKWEVRPPSLKAKVRPL